MIKSIKKFIIRTPPRRSELSAIRKLRISSLWICYACVLIYVCWKSYKLAQDEITLIYYQDSGNPISAPTVRFTADYNFTVNCTTYYFNDAMPPSDCNKYVDKSAYQVDPGYWKANFNTSDLMFNDPDNPNNVGPIIQAIVLTVNISDRNFQGDDANLYALFADRDTLPDLELASKVPGIKGVSNYEATAKNGNFYYLANNQSYTLLYERRIYSRLNQNAINVLSGNGDHKPIAMINSILVSYPDPANKSYADVNISPNSYVVVTETEKSVVTISDLFSAVGGIYTTAISIYVVLYGSEKIRPWGLIQNLPCIRHKVRTVLYDNLTNYGKSEKSLKDYSGNPNVPFLDPALSKNLPVEQRLLSLELFLKEYVVCVDNIILKSDADIESPPEKNNSKWKFYN